MAIDWKNAEIVEVEYPTCPHCGNPDYIRYRTEASGDGTKFHRAVCRACSREYLVFFPLPPWGNSEVEIS